MTEHRSRRPLIGVTAGTARMMSGAWEGHEAVVLTEHYTAALRAAGARPVILAPQDPWTDEEVAELDAVVLTGGTDLDPALLGEDPLPTDLPPSPERDDFEIALYRAARRTGVPVLGICRGLQIIAVAEGGTLHRHLPVDVPAHPRTGERVSTVALELDAASDTALALGTRAVVSAFHHQGIAEVPAALRVVGRHASGLALALEITGESAGESSADGAAAGTGAPVIGVQWHPELDPAERAGHGLFATLVAQAGSRCAVRPGAAPGLR